ncbi:ribonuclease [Brevundimonas sp.]|uniref:ribonuclease n=1 Tax=Brevundimonas sp. TaxID=1871086 RepID=UPI001DB98DA1|nr:ribonuclease [Brevundimonas sp.]MBL0948898.1 ribonuclease [Brevundimonas sp.]
MADPETPPETDECREARIVGERPDLGHTPDALSETLDQDQLDRALTGSDSGSDTRAGSLRGGSASGSDIDPDSDTINAELSRMGRDGGGSGRDQTPSGTGPVRNTGDDRSSGGDADASTG